MQPHGVRDAGKPESPADQHGGLPRVRGWLLVYFVTLAILLFHGAELTIASIVVYKHPSVAGIHSPVPLSFLLFYVITNVILIIYAACLFFLMFRRRRSAVVNNIVWNILSIVFLVAWNFAGEKSNIGVLVDAAPNIVGAAYFLRSKRVRNTFILGSRSGSR